MSSEFFQANGKLLLFGEYFVLDGCRALAWPTRFGQTLTVNSDSTANNRLIWKSIDHTNQTWFEAQFDENLNLLFENELETALVLQKILKQAQVLNPDFLLNGESQEAMIKANYPSEWGLGSSSTLISLIAQWARVNPLELFFKTLTGSGYDVACATASTPISYVLHAPDKVSITPLNLPITALNGVHFLYLGKKQSSANAVLQYQKSVLNKIELAMQLDEIIQSYLANLSASSLRKAMNESEDFIANNLRIPKVKDLYFSDFPGSVKSLGAWGGDFVMALPEDPSFDSKAYFKMKGFETCFEPEEMILS